MSGPTGETDRGREVDGGRLVYSPPDPFVTSYLFPPHVTQQCVCVQGCCDRDGTSWFSLCSHKQEAGDSPPCVSLLLHGLGQVPSCLWAQDPHPWKKKVGWAGSEGKPVLWPHTHTHTHHLPSVIDTHPHHTRTSHGHRPTHAHTSHTHHRPLGGHHQPHLHYHLPSII